MAGPDDHRVAKRNSVHTGGVFGWANTGVGSATESESRGRIAYVPQIVDQLVRSDAIRCAPQYTYGQVKAFTLQSDAFRQYDASVFKNFALPGESVLSFRVEFFNLPNTNQLQRSQFDDQFVVVLHGDFDFDSVSRHSICSEVQLLTQRAQTNAQDCNHACCVPPRYMRRLRLRSRILYPFKSTSRSPRDRIRQSTAGLAMTSRTTRR